MNVYQLLRFAKIVLTKLQKRDRVETDRTKLFNITYKKDTLSFNEYELALAIGIVLCAYHQIPVKYLCYYIKYTGIGYDNVLPLPKRLAFVKKILKRLSIKGIVLAGGSFTTTTIQIQQGKKVVVKTAKGWASQKLVNEGKLLRKLSLLPDVNEYIPTVLNLKVKQQTSLTLVYYPFDTLSYKILFNKISFEEAWDVSIKVLIFAKTRLWSKNISKNTDGYINDFFLERIKTNAELLTNLSPMFSSIVNKNEITINGKSYFNLLKIVDIIIRDKGLVEFLRPPKLSIIWGDLHPNNILLTKSKFILVDPRGDCGDSLYDLCKMYHTYGPGRYDFVDNDLYNVNIELVRNFTVRRQFFTLHPAWKTYNYLEKRFLENIKDFIDPEDKHWQLRFHFINFCIFATMPPFLIKNELNEPRAVIGYTNAVILGNRFLSIKSKYL